MGLRFYSDSYDDIVWLHPTSGMIGTWNIFEGSPIAWTTAGYAFGDWTPWHIGNFVGADTSESDFLFWNEATGGVGVWEIFNGNVVSWTVLGTGFVGSSNWYIAGHSTNDLNGDGYTDVVWHNPLTLDVGVWTVVDGTAQWTAIGTGGIGWGLYAIGDVTGDQKDDLIWLKYSTAEVGAWDMASGSPTWTPLGTAGAGWTIELVGDFTGDGYEDILWSNSWTGDVGIWDRSATGFDWREIGTFDLDHWEIRSFGDYTGDGQDDILWQSRTPESSQPAGYTGFTDLSAGDSLDQAWHDLGFTGAGWFAG